MRSCEGAFGLTQSGSMSEAIVDWVRKLFISANI